MTKTIKKLAREYAKQILGPEQFKKNKPAAQSIEKDFSAGYSAARGEQYNDLIDLRLKYEGLMGEFCNLSGAGMSLKEAIFAIRENQAAEYYSTVKYDLLVVLDSGGGIEGVRDYLAKLPD